jgi:apolipoprotein N-acyltransferase
MDSNLKILFLPILSALFLILSLPPIHWWWLSLISFSFLYYSFRTSSSVTQAIACGTTFGLFLSIYLAIAVLEGFRWIEGGEILVVMMYVVSFLVILGTSSLSALVAVVSYRLSQALFKSYKRDTVMITMIIISPLLYVGIDKMISLSLKGFNYGSLQYIVLKSPAVAYLHILPISVLVFLFLIINVLIVEYIIFSRWQRNEIHKAHPDNGFIRYLSIRKIYFLTITSVIITILFILPYILYVKGNNVHSVDELIIATIQSNERNPNVVFGTVTEDIFSSPHLESLVASALRYNPDIIIYPFNPWSGAMMADGSSASFDRNVIAVTEIQFSRWVQEHIPDNVTFVTWYSVYRSGHFYNEVGFWNQGKLVGTYQKQVLFPFFDYTPDWASRASLFSVPFDGTPGKNTEPIKFSNSLKVGSIICSEITEPKAIRYSIKGADILFSIGSEAMFTHEIPATFNFLHARGLASRYRTPVVRATKFGPSGVFDINGNILNELMFKEEGVMVTAIKGIK